MADELALNRKTSILINLRVFGKMINIWTQSQSIALHRNIVHEIQELSLLPCTLPLVCACPCRKNRNREFMRCVKHVYLNRKNCCFLLGFVPTKWFDVYWIDEKIILISSNTHAQKAIENLWIADFGLEINKFKVFHVINAYAILRQTCLATLSCLFFSSSERFILTSWQHFQFL